MGKFIKTVPEILKKMVVKIQTNHSFQSILCIGRPTLQVSWKFKAPRIANYLQTRICHTNTHSTVGMTQKCKLGKATSKSSFVSRLIILSSGQPKLSLAVWFALIIYIYIYSDTKTISTLLKVKVE